MSKQQIATRVVSVVPSGTITRKRFVNFSWAQAGAGESILGVADEQIEPGIAGRVIVGETAIVESGAAINGSETRLMSDAQGRVIVWTTGNTIAGRLVRGQTATAAGQFVEVYLFSR